MNKKIILIGPAPESTEYMKGSEIDSYDLVVRINKSPMLVNEQKEKIGSRTDVLFHNLYFHNEEEKHRSFSSKILKAQCNKYLIYPYADKDLLDRFYLFSFEEKELQTKRLSEKWFKSLKLRLDVRLPTTGMQAIYFLINQNFKELHITGFTFFSTGYLPNYCENVVSGVEAMSQALGAGNHNPEAEKKLFVKIYNSLKNKKKIILDKKLQEIVTEIIHN